MKLIYTKYPGLLFFLAVVFFAACKKKREERDIVKSIQQTGQLITAEYTLSKMVKANDNKTWYKLGDRKILISVEAVEKAGVNLQQVAKEDVTISDYSIRLRLPSPKVFSVSIPPDKIKVQYQEVSFFRSAFSASEREALLAQAEGQIRKLADSLGILQTAKTNAETFLRRLLQQGRFKNISVEFTR